MRVTTDILQLTSNKTADAATDIHATMNNLAGVMWVELGNLKGKAGDSARLAFSTLMKNMKEISEALNEMSAALRKTEAHYTETDNDRAQDIAKVTEAATAIHSVLVPK